MPKGRAAKKCEVRASFGVFCFGIIKIVIFSLDQKTQAIQP
jgi:hypothetical protein